MAYRVKLHPNVVKRLKKLPLSMSDRIKKKLKTARKNPFRFLEHYEGASVYKLRVGDYRLLIDVDFGNKILKIRVLGHRRKIYKKVKF